MAERNQIKERNNIRIDIFGYRFQKGLILLSQPIMRITRTFLPFYRSLPETFREDNSK